MAGKEKVSLKPGSKQAPCVMAVKPTKLKGGKQSSQGLSRQMQSKLAAFCNTTAQNANPSFHSVENDPDLEAAIETEGTDWASVEDDLEIHDTEQGTVTHTWADVTAVDASNLLTQTNGAQVHDHGNDNDQHDQHNQDDHVSNIPFFKRTAVQHKVEVAPVFLAYSWIQSGTERTP